jgi:hypothetical protein
MIGKESEEVGTATLGALLLQRKIIEEGEQEVIDNYFLCFFYLSSYVQYH